MIGAFVGASAGVLVRVWANFLGKRHFLARPWNHVIFAGVGGFVGYNYTRWEDEMRVSVNELRKKKGLPEVSRKSLIPEIVKPEL